MERAPAPPWRRLSAPLLLVAGWVALLVLSRRPPGAPAPLPPWPATALTVLVAWLSPGFCLLRLLGRRRSGLEDAAFAFGLGLSFLLAAAGALLVLHSNIDTYTATVTAGSGLLVLLELGRRWRGRARGAAPPPRGPRPPALLALLATLGLLLAVSARARGFTFGGDEWFHMRSARQFLDARVIDSTMMLDAWSFVLALLVKLAGLDLIEAYRTLLLPFLITGAALAFVALARAVLRSWPAAALAFALHALLCVSDMQTRGEGAGMALLCRLTEDKYAGLLIAVPLALAAFLDFLRRGPRRLPVVCALLSLTAVVLQPLALFWIGLPAGGLLAFWWWRSRERPRGWIVAALAVAALAVGLAWFQRGLRPDAAFRLYAPEWPFNVQLLELARRRLYILSLQRGWFMAHGALLGHPLTLCALLATLAALPRFGRSLSARFLVLAMGPPVLLAYNPLTATALGRWIMPWMVPRLLWAMPVALVLADLLGRALGRRRGGARRRPPRWAPAAAVALAALLLSPRIGQSLGAQKARNRVFVSAGERELMHFAMAAPLRGLVLAPRGLGVRLSVWSRNLQACPSLDSVRSPGEHVDEIRDCHKLLKARRVDERFVARLTRRGIGYIAAPSGSAIDRALAPLPAFQPLFRGEEYTFYAWRPERWAGPAS